MLFLPWLRSWFSWLTRFQILPLTCLPPGPSGKASIPASTWYPNANSKHDPHSTWVQVNILSYQYSLTAPITDGSTSSLFSLLLPTITSLETWGTQGGGGQVVAPWVSPLEASPCSCFQLASPLPHTAPSVQVHWALQWQFRARPDVFSRRTQGSQVFWGNQKDKH